MAAGTLVDWIGESGPFYTVSLPGETGQDNLVGYVLASEVEVVGMRLPAGVGPPAGAVAGAAADTMSIPDLERQYEREMARRSSGKKKVIWGLVLAAASYAALEWIPPLQVPDPADYDDPEDYQSAQDRRSAAETGRTVVTGLGAALGTWGAGQWVLGFRNTRNLGLDRRQAAAPSLDERYAQAQEKRSAGRRKVFWGVFLTGATYAAVAWIPYFGVPVEDEFETPQKYEEALDRRDRVETFRTWATVLGGGLGAWGGTQWILAAREMSEIEGLVRNTTAALAVPLTTPAAKVKTDLFVGVHPLRGRTGPRTAVGLRWTW